MIGEHLSWAQAAFVLCVVSTLALMVYVVAVTVSCFGTVKRGATLNKPCHTTKRNGTEAVP